MLKSHDATSLSVLREEKEVAEERREESPSSPQAWPAYWQQSRECRDGRMCAIGPMVTYKCRALRNVFYRTEAI
jgi:hypothetical protein